MIYIFAGNDTKNIRDRVNFLSKGREVHQLGESNLSAGVLLSHASHASLFGEAPALVIRNLISESDVILSDSDLSALNDSPVMFLLLEDKILAAVEKKYKKYASIERFEEKKPTTQPKVNTFAIADAYAKRDKITAWTLYCQAIESDVAPESISGILFWKIKNMYMTGSRVFSPEELQRNSSELVSIYHRSHRGECDFAIGLEQFILSSLSSK